MTSSLFTDSLKFEIEVFKFSLIEFHTLRFLNLIFNIPDDNLFLLEVEDKTIFEALLVL